MVGAAARAACHASARSVRTSLLRSALPQLQAELHEDPELLGVRGAAVNVLLVRPSAGEIGRHEKATLRRAPQRRTMHAVELVRPHGHRWWVANVHSHNRPVPAAERDTTLALQTLQAWAGEQPALLLGDLNLDAQGAARCTRRAGAGAARQRPRRSHRRHPREPTHRAPARHTPTHARRAGAPERSPPAGG